MVTLLGLAQDISHSSLTKVPKSVVLRARKDLRLAPLLYIDTLVAETRKTYRAVLSEPRLIVPDSSQVIDSELVVESVAVSAPPTQVEPPDAGNTSTQNGPKKRPLETALVEDGPPGAADSGETRKKKRKKGNKT
jgi:ribonuclease P/MRP protein subunit RPP1